jgi:hypothetical protein
LIRYITSPFCTPHSICISYTTIVRPKMEYASLAWYSITLTDLFKLERVQGKYASLYHSRSSMDVRCNDDEAILARLNLSTLYSRRHLDALFLISVLKSNINYSSIIGSVSVRIST